MVRYYLYILNALKFLLFLWIIVIFSSIFDFDKVVTNPEEELVFTDVINSVKNIFTYIIYYCLFFVAYFSALGVALLFSRVPLFESGFMFNFIRNFFKFYLNKWFSFPNGEAPDLSQIPRLILEQVLVFTGDIYLLSFQIMFAVAFFYAVRAIFKNNPSHALITIGSLVLMIIVPLMIFGFLNMMNLFTVTIPFLEDLENPISPTLTSIPIDDIFRFLGSPVALLTITCYIYLEFTFQINYIDTVTKPSIERGERLSAQLDILRKESSQITANVEKVKQEAQTQRKKLGVEEKEDIGKFFAKTSKRFSYVKEMIEKKKLEEEEKKLISSASKTRKLGRYIERLFKEDPESKDTITAKSSAPRAQSLAKSTAINFGSRILILIFLSFIIIHPRWFFKNIFNLPPAITDSVEMYSPETVIILLIPFMLLFPVISALISYIKHRNLIIRLKQEGRIKDILASVGDYVKKEEPKKEAEEGEDEEPKKEEPEDKSKETE